MVVLKIQKKAYQSGLLAVGCGHSMTTSCLVVPSRATVDVVVSLVSEILYKKDYHKVIKVSTTGMANDTHG